MDDSLAPALHGKKILVTGGSLGLGLASAHACLKRGARVAICARTLSDLENAKRELEAASGTAVPAIEADMSEAVDVTRTFDEAERRLGTLDGVIHAAGIYGPIGPITDIEPQAWLAAITVNLFGTFLVAREAAGRLKRSGGGRIVLYAGGGAATPFPNYTAYASGKAAVVRFCETIAIELAPYNIEVNALSPGFVATRFHQQTLAAGASAAGNEFLARTEAELAKGGVPARVGADCAAFLVSDAARGITGKFVAAPYDGYADWPRHVAELRSSDIFTLRRILPKERGLDWH